MLSAVMSNISAGTAAPLRRIEAIDLARGFALVAMAIYHFGWDLEFFGYLEPGTTLTGGWRLFARCIASSFLFLVGVSLVLAHRGGMRRGPYLKRLAMVSAAAAAITAGTYVAIGQGFIFFGILHHIALASVIGLAFLRSPWWLTLAVAVAAFLSPQYLRSEIFASPWWWWLGLSPVDPPSNDYVPLLPWFAAVLAGMGIADLAYRAGLLHRLSHWHPGSWSVPMRFAGRHSLAVYLIHQPVLIGLLWLGSQVVPPSAAQPEIRFQAACIASCAQNRDEAFCAAYCDCARDSLLDEGLMDTAMNGAAGADELSRMEGIASMCTARVDGEEMPAQEGAQ